MQLHIFGLGFIGQAVAALMPPSTVTTRLTLPDVTRTALGHATHLLITAPPARDLNDPFPDPCLSQFAATIQASPSLRWIGYCSTTGVYGDRQGGLVDETTQPAPTQTRSVRRLEVEQAWRAIRPDLPLDLFRLAGIYGPGRNVFDALRAGQAKCIIAPNHRFSRIHGVDAARAILAAIMRPASQGVRVLHLADDCPAASSDVMLYAAHLLGLPAPPPILLEDALPGMTPMARSFWMESRLIDNNATKRALGLSWFYPSYIEGLNAILAEETQQERNILRP